MKILLLTTHLEMGGIPIYVVELAKGLKRHGHTPVVASSGGSLETRLKEEGIAHRKVNCRTSSELNPKVWLAVFPRLVAIVRQEHPQLIHAHTRVTQMLASVLSWCLRIPYVSTCHGLYRFRFGRRFFRCWGQWVMAISGASMDRLVKQYKLAPPHKVVLIRNGVDVDYFLQSVDPQEAAHFKQALGLTGSPMIGAIARFSPVKGLDSLLRAFPRVLAAYPNAQILLVGDGPAKPDLIRLCFALKIADHVVISHPVDDTRLPLSLMDVFAAPSLREGFGLAIVEAMAAGVPVVASSAGGPREILQDGAYGLLVPPEDPEALANAILELLSDDKKRAEISERARRRAQNDFDMKRVVREVEAVYADVLA